MLLCSLLVNSSNAADWVRDLKNRYPELSFRQASSKMIERYRSSIGILAIRIVISKRHSPVQRR